MKKILIYLLILASVSILSCSVSDDDEEEAEGKKCESNSDCPIGYRCSSSGICASEDQSDSGSDAESGEQSDTSSEHEGEKADLDSDPEENSDNDSGSNSGVYDTELSPDEDVEFCEDSCVPMEPECLPPILNEAEAGLCNGLDDDCDGAVDEGCPCKAGETQACFMGPRNYRNIGSCKDGVQTCVIQMRAVQGDWGMSPCVGGISPSGDICDSSDNNCNGCIDDKLCCEPPINCAYDIGTATPFTDKIIDGNDIYDTGHKFNDADTATWEWTLTKGPCDIVLDKVNSFVKGAKTLDELSGEGSPDTTVSGVGFSKFKVKFRLSGSYKLHLKVTRSNGEVYECEWILRVVSDGLRIELCWDTTGDHSQGGRDLDLHLGKNGTTKDSLLGFSGWTESSACYFSTCKYDATSGPNWGYANTTNYDKDGNEREMRNPRLDIDNIRTPGEPENINVDNPDNGDMFRVLVRIYSWSDYSATSSDTHPVVNVYCGGTLKATYGVEPQVTGYRNNDDSWKVVEIKWVGDPDSDACELDPQFNESGYIVNEGKVPKYDEW